MNWDRSTAIGLARLACTYCDGLGTRVIRHGKEVPCNCVFRRAFRACLNRYRECSMNGCHASTISLEMPRGKQGMRTYSRKNEEYMADFCLVSKRTLSDADHKVFNLHFLLGGDWRLCCKQLHIDRGTFFHAVYRIEQQLGKTFAELKPHALWPLAEYFAGSIDRSPPLMLNADKRIQVNPYRLDRLGAAS